MSSSPRLLRGSAPFGTLLVLCATLFAPAASGEMYQYVDARGRMHFTQDIGQVPPEYRSQVERKELGREISVTGSERARGDGERMKVMDERRRQLEKAARMRQRQQAVPASRRRPDDPLTGAPEPQKYWKDCSDYDRTQRCRRVLTSEWRRWNAANGGNNGKPVLRRKANDH